MAGGGFTSDLEGVCESIRHKADERRASACERKRII
jgi:hypothetical protein